jgi:hypothetical protein
MSLERFSCPHATHACFLPSWTLQDCSLDDGDIARLLTRTVDLLRQVCGCCKGNAALSASNPRPRVVSRDQAACLFLVTWAPGRMFLLPMRPNLRTVHGDSVR